MGNEIQTTTLSEIEKVLVGGDLSKMTPDQRTSYYMQVCSSLGLNPLTKPFEYITLNGRLVLYANRNCAEQLRRVYGVSITDMLQQINGDILTVTVKGCDKEGRQDVASGTVCLAGLKGEGLANAYLKAETKAKRRLTLSLCGLGMLDETEVETIPSAKKGEVAETFETAKPLPPPTPVAPKFGVLIKGIVDKTGVGYPEFTEELFKALLPYYMDALSPQEAAGWKDKGAAMASCYDGSDAGDKEAIITTANSLAQKMTADEYQSAY